MTREVLISKSLTRRTILSGGAFLVGNIVQSRILPESRSYMSAAVARNSAPELYVFPGSSRHTTVIATTWPVRSLKSGSVENDPATVRIHTGSISRTIALPASLTSNTWFDEGAQIYAGYLQSGPNGDHEIAAVVLEAENGLLGEGTLNVWAERVGGGMKRQRVGSPFLSSITAQDPSLAGRYHSISPEQDTLLLSRAIAVQITASARLARHVSEPDEYGLRVASILLPDVLHYDPKLPLGFSFAAQNGRHPGDDSASVVATIMNGVSATSRSTCHAKMWQTFPYLSVS